MKKFILPLFPLLLTGCGNTQSETATNEPVALTTPIPAPEQETTTDGEFLLTDKSVTGDAVYNGIIDVPPHRYATLSLHRGGTVKSIHFQPGEPVRAGALLATIEDPEYIEIQQEYLDARAQLEYLEQEYHRQERLSKNEAASQKRFQQSKSEYLSMKSRMEGTASQLQLLGFNTEKIISEGIQPSLQIKAPLTGYIASTNINLGKHMEHGEPLFSIIDKSELLVHITVYENNIREFRLGEEVTFRTGSSDQAYTATITSVGQQIDETNRSLAVFAKIKEPAEWFRPGMYVTVGLKKK